MAEEMEYLLRLHGAVPYVYASNLCLEISQTLSVSKPILVVRLV